MVCIILMVDLEYGKGLRLGSSCIVTALGGLDCFASLCGTARGRLRVFAFSVRGGGGEGCACEADGQSDGEDGGGELHGVFV
jgi:hypothetical protein